MKSKRKCLPPFREIRNTIQKVEGWLTENEAKYLYSLAYRGPGKGALVEIGSWKGKSTIVLATGSRAAGRERVYAIDHHKGGLDQEGLGYVEVDTEAEFRQNIKNAGIEDYVVPMVRNPVKRFKSGRDRSGFYGLMGIMIMKPLRMTFYYGNLTSFQGA